MNLLIKYILLYAKLQTFLVVSFQGQLRRIEWRTTKNGVLCWAGWRIHIRTQITEELRKRILVLRKGLRRLHCWQMNF